ISWFEYLYLQIKGKRLSNTQSKLFEQLAIALSNPGPRDHSVRAAMNAGVGGSTPASALMAALAIGAGQYGGARELFLISQMWHSYDKDIDLWIKSLKEFPQKEERLDIWPQMEHPPGFQPYGKSSSTIVKQILDCLYHHADKDGALSWLKSNQDILETAAGLPLSKTAVAAAAMNDLGFSPEESEMLYLLLRLPGVVAHTLERNEFGWREHPFAHDGIQLTSSVNIKSK
ncbi:citryl-CoA lyase, partial [Pseudomonadota bacterium]